MARPDHDGRGRGWPDRRGAVTAPAVSVASLGRAVRAHRLARRRPRRDSHRRQSAPGEPVRPARSPMPAGASPWRRPARLSPWRAPASALKLTLGTESGPSARPVSIVGVPVAGVLLNSRSPLARSARLLVPTPLPNPRRAPIATPPRNAHPIPPHAPRTAYARAVTTALTGLLAPFARNAALGFSDPRTLDMTIGRLQAAHDRLRAVTPPPAILAVHQRTLAVLAGLRHRLPLWLRSGARGWTWPLSAANTRRSATERSWAASPRRVMLGSSSNSEYFGSPRVFSGKPAEATGAGPAGPSRGASQSWLILTPSAPGRARAPARGGNHSGRRARRVVRSRARDERRRPRPLIGAGWGSTPHRPDGRRPVVFLGDHASVVYGDKNIGTHHADPPKRHSRGHAQIGPTIVAMCSAEHMPGHARGARDRLPRARP